MRWWSTAPSIIAEALVGVPDALLTALRPGAPATGAAVAARLASSLGPSEHEAQPPSWLLPQQVPSFRRVLYAIHHYRGALLADPVGSGKTFIALAVAAELNRGATACLVPATLVPQWQAAANRLSIPVTVCSHERVSRGRLPHGTRGLVIIDESHHFRNPQTRRYRHVAPWLVGRRALLLTATPIVNRLTDLGHQLLLALPDDDLALDGIASLRAMFRRGSAEPALGQVVFERDAGIEDRPRRVYTASKPTGRECASVQCTLELVSHLRLSKCETIAGLIRGVLLRAAGSSPAAFVGGLRRYRRLLLHARDASAAGRTIERIELKRFTRELDDQLVWWELLPITQAQSEIELGDLDQLEGVISHAEAAAQGPDGKLTRLHRLLADEIPSLIFTASRDTVHYLRSGLADLRIAWCTGDRAGIGAAALPRRVVLGWFREPTTSSIAPRHLVVTDVAAEGLDLQRAARVVHYDLPWNPMRMEQREGRSVRYGSLNPEVTVVQFTLPPLLERRLRLQAGLARKVKLPAAAGLGSSGRHIWRWRAELAERFRRVTPAHGVASVIDCTPGLLAGFAFYRPGDPRPRSATVLWLDHDGGWTEAPEVIGTRLDLAGRQTQIMPVEHLEEWLTLLTRPIRDRLAFTRSRRWIMPDPTPAVHRAVALLQCLIREAARRHDPKALAELERALAFVAGGHTAGEAVLVDRLANATSAELMTLMSRLPAGRSEGEDIEVQLTGLVVFGPAKPDTVEVASPDAEAPDRLVRSRRHADRFHKTDSRQLPSHAHPAQPAGPER